LSVLRLVLRSVSAAAGAASWAVRCWCGVRRLWTDQSMKAGFVALL